MADCGPSFAKPKLTATLYGDFQFLHRTFTVSHKHLILRALVCHQFYVVEPETVAMTDVLRHPFSLFLMNPHTRVHRAPLQR